MIIIEAMEKNGLKIWKRISGITVTAFGLNLLWEMGQMIFFAGMSLFNLQDWMRCSLATFGDILIILTIYIIGCILFRSWSWSDHFNFIKFFYIEFLGITMSVLIEFHALSIGKWAYSSLMPLIPFTKIGLLPVLQMMLLPYLSFQSKWFTKSHD